MQIELGIAPDSWGAWYPEDDNQTPWQRCLDEMKQAGYEGVELGPWGYFPKDHTILSEELKKRELRLIAGTATVNFADDASCDAAEREIMEIADLLNHFSSSRYMVLLPEMMYDRITGNQILPYPFPEETWSVIYRNIQRTAERIRSFSNYDVIPVLHPYMFSYIWKEEEIGRVLDHTDIAICPDIVHLICGGTDPIAFYKKHADRIPYIHLTECDRSVLPKLQNSCSFAELVSDGIMCEPGKGKTDYNELLCAMKEAGFEGWVTVEQDLYPVRNFDLPLAIALRTRKYLKRLGI